MIMIRFLKRLCLLGGLLPALVHAQFTGTGITLQNIASDDDTTGLRSFIFSTLDQTADLSYQFLSILFGPVVSSSTPNLVISEVFRALNFGVLSILSVIIGYTVVLTAVSTSQDSTGAFSQRVSPWALGRTVIGASMMMPMQSGYCALQVIVMKVVLMGVGFANTAWVTVLNYNQAGVVVNVAQSAPAITNDDKEELANYLKDVAILAARDYMQHCVIGSRVTGSTTVAYNAVMNRCSSVALVRAPGLSLGLEGYKFIGADGNPSVIRNTDGSVELVTYRYANITNPSRPAANASVNPSFGGVEWTGMKPIIRDAREAVVRRTIQQMIIATQTSAALAAASPTATANYQYWDSASGAMTDDLSTTTVLTLLQSFLNPVQGSALATDTAYLSVSRVATRFIRTVIGTISDQYSALMSALVSNRVPVTSTTQTWQDDAKAKGWLSAGMYYKKIMASSNRNAISVTYTQQTPQRSLIPFAPPVAPTNAVMSIALPQEVATNLENFHNNMKNVLKYTNSSSDIIADIIPAMSGRTAGDTWIWGIDVGLPIKNMVSMILKVSQRILGVRLFNSDGNAWSATWCNPNDQGVCASNTCYDRLKNARDITAATTAISDCLLTSGLFVSFRDGYVDPIAASTEIGRDLISYATHYYTSTIQGLYDELTTLAWAYYGTTLPVNLAAEGAAAFAYGSPGSLTTTLIKVAKDVTIAGLRMAYTGTKTAIEMYVPMGTALAGVFLGLGVMLGVYIPLLPFMLFLFGAVSWMMSVAEALVAAPLVGLGVTHPEGHDLLGKSEQALILLLGVFIRPITLLFGLLMAILVSQVIFKVFNIAFITVAMKILSDASDDSGGLGLMVGIAAGGILLIYVYAMISVIEQSYSLIYQVPDRILRWVGGPQDQSMVGQLSEQAKGETQQAAGQAASGIGASTKGPDVGAKEGGGELSPPESGPKTEKGEGEGGGTDVSSSGGGSGGDSGGGSEK